MTFLEGVYWDLDGTIANTELEAHLPAFNKAFNYFELNWNWDEDTYVRLLKINGGKNRIEYYSKKINHILSTEEVIKIHERKQHYYNEFVLQNSLKLKVGVYRLIKELFKKRVRQFIVTSSSRQQANLITKFLFRKFNPFEFIISSDDVLFHKPNPMPYQKAMKLSGIKNCNSIVFEDSSPGLKSAIAAKLPTIYVPSNLPTVIDKDIELDCFLDTLGSETNKTNVVKGPEMDNKYVDYYYLNKFLKFISDAKN